MAEPTIDPPIAPQSAADALQNPETSESKQNHLTDLIARATAAYAIKDYSPAAEFYSQATELQAELNGEMSTENADLLYSYGKCLYFVAVSNSDVLGGTAAGAKLGPGKEERKTKKRKLNGSAAGQSSEPQQHEIPHSKAEAEADGLAASFKKEEEEAAPDAAPELVPTATEGGVTDVVPEADLRPSGEQKEATKPYFQFTGDENWDQSDSDEEEPTEAANGEAEPEDDEDDFVNAYEVLDLARVLLLRKLDQREQTALEDSEKGKYIASIDLTPEVRQVKDRLADVHDLQAEISLEGEKFANAVVDLKAALALREELDPPESSALAECHYKLSLALEFSAVQQQLDETGNPTGAAKVEEKVRAQAVVQMEKAIASCRARVVKEEDELQRTAEEAQVEKQKENIEEVKGMVAEMEQRLEDLRKPFVTVRQSQMADNPVAGVMGQIMGADEDKQKEVLMQALASANDLTGMVKRKKAKANGEGSASMTPEPSASVNVNVDASTNGNGTGKRKMEALEEVEESDSSKKARVEDGE